MRKDLRNRKIRIEMSAFSNRNRLYNPVIPCLLFYQGKHANLRLFALNCLALSRSFAKYVVHNAGNKPFH